MLTPLQKLALIWIPCSLAISTTALATLVAVDTASIAEAQLPPKQTVARSTQALTKTLASQTAVSQPEKMVAAEHINPIATATQQFVQGESMRQSGNVEQALEHYGQALAITQSEGHRSFEGVILHRVAQVYADAQDAQHATQFYQAAIAIARNTDNDYVLSEALANFGELSERQGNAKQALAYYQESLPKVRLIGNQPLDRQVVARIQVIKQQQTIAKAAAKAKRPLSTKSEVALNPSVKPIVN